MNLPTPSAWRYTHHLTNGTIAYQYDTDKPKNCNHPNYTPMFTQGQVMQMVNRLQEEIEALITEGQRNEQLANQNTD